MDEREAREVLFGQPLVPVLEGSMAYAKELLAKCLDGEIPAILERPNHRGKS